MKTHSFIIKLKKNGLIMEFVLMCAVWFSFLKMALGERVHDVLAVISIVFGLAIGSFSILDLKPGRKIFIVWTSMLALGLINILKVGNLYTNVFLSMLFSYFPIAVCFTYSRYLSLSIWRNSYIIAALYMVFRVSTATDEALLFDNISRNNLSVLLLGWLVIYAIVCHKNSTKLPAWSVVLYVISCIVAVGRFGIFVGLLLGCLYFIYCFSFDEIKGYRVSTKFVIVLFSVIVSAAFVYFAWGQIKTTVFSRFAEIGLAGSDNRLEMVSDYYNALTSWQKIIFGTQRMDIRSIAARDGNPHNSYVYAHMYFGLCGFVFLVVSIIQMVLYYKKERNYTFMVLVVAFAARILTDSVFPGSFGGDITFWLLLFNMYKKKDRHDNDLRVRFNS